jgi:predicted permease
MHVVNTLAPIVLVVLLGAALRRSGFAPERFFAEGRRLVYWVALPCLLFHKTASAGGQFGGAMRLFLALFGGMVACVAVGFVAALALRVPRRSIGAFVQGAYRGNLAYVGLPVILYAFSANGAQAPARIEAVAIVAIAPLIPLYNILAVPILLAGQEHAEERLLGRLRQVGLKTVTNPLTIACVLGLAWALTGRALPPMLGRTIGCVAGVALPLVLLGLGASLSLSEIRSDAVATGTAVFVKLVVSPAAGYLIGRALGLDTDALRIALLYLACPTAVMSFVMAEQLGSDARLSGSIVMASTVCSVVSLAAILAFL